MRAPASPLSGVHHVHLVGAGGIGMLAIGQYLVHKGIRVTGSDLRDGTQIERARNAGIGVTIGHASKNIEGADLVVTTAAADEQNIEVTAASEQGIPVIKRAELLGSIASSGRSVAVAGTHGKTTTSAMTGHLLRAVGAAPTIFTGGFVLSEDGTSDGPCIPGSDDLFIVEADEYDRSFLHLHPTVSIVTSLDFDHPDCYANFDDMAEAYRLFLKQTTERVIVASTFDRVTSITSDLSIPVETYALERDATWVASDLRTEKHGARFSLSREGQRIGSYLLQIPGRHNVENAVAAIAGAVSMTGKDALEFREPLTTFRGIERRLQIKGVTDGVTLVDDYAHHPTEVRASLSALEGAGRRLRVIFQPHTYSRTQSSAGGVRAEPLPRQTSQSS